MPVSEQVALVRAAFEAFTRGDARALTALVTDDVEFHAPTASLAREGRPYRGAEGLREYLADATALWEELRVEPRDFHEAGDTVVALGRVYAWGAGRVVDAPAAWLWKVRDGRLAYGRVFENQQEALEAAGLTAP